NPGWAQEISLAVEWAHAIAPAAHILLVEARTSSLSNLLGAVDYAASQPGVVTVSMSWGGGEFSGETADDFHFNHPELGVVASDCDSPGDEYPALSPHVVAGGVYPLKCASSGP